MEQRDFKGVWIPREIWLDTNLTIPDKFYLAVFRETKDSRLTDNRMLDVVSLCSLNRIKKRLIKLGYIDNIIDPEVAKIKTIELHGTGYTCEWCGSKNYILEAHHFPISKSRGGINVVHICPNCHATYHALLKE